MKTTRKAFILGTGAAAAAFAADRKEGAPKTAEEKTVDGGLADVTKPGIPERKSPLVPPGARGVANFRTRCVGCQLCVQQCPNGVLRPPSAKGALQPVMAFDVGWCRPECTRCGSVCPTGAIRPITAEEKSRIHVGHAIWHADRCLAATEGVSCTACQRHCPAHAIALVPMEGDGKNAPRVPVIDKMKCLGCGACEHLCPARPLPAMTLKGFENHREVEPMDDAGVLAEARRLFEMKKAAVVVVRDGMICASGNGRGLSPLLDLCDRSPEDVRGAWVVDKVIGKAAAAVCVSFGAKRVHAELMCEPAQALLKEHGVAASADQLVPKILNRDQTGLCPLEQTVKDLSEVPAMLAAIRAKLRELRKTDCIPRPFSVK